MWKSIGALVAPSYFVSYSSRQRPFAEALRHRLGAQARQVWFDRDALRTGDAWREEIRRGVASSDELVLLISPDSLASIVVIEEEVGTAKEMRKAIRPFAILPCDHDQLPQPLRELQYRDVSRLGEVAAVNAIAEYLETVDSEADIQLKSCRGIHPAFDAALAMADGRPNAMESLAVLNSLRSRYDPSSTIWLNVGLAACMVGEWSKGVELLRRYATAANNFPGWYFLALHLLRRRLVLNLSVSEVNEARDAVRRALAMQPHPLAFLLCAIIEGGGLNLGPRQVEQRLRSFLDVSTASREAAEEIKRHFWCIQPSLQVLGRHGPAIANYLKELSRE